MFMLFVCSGWLLGDCVHILSLAFVRSGLDDSIKELEKQRGLLEPRLQFTSQLAEVNTV